MTMPRQINFLRDFGKSKRASPASSDQNIETLPKEEKSALQNEIKVVKTKSEIDFDIYSE